MNLKIASISATFILALVVVDGRAADFGDLVKSNAAKNANACIVKATTPEISTIKEIFPTVIYKTPGGDAGAAQMFQPVRNIGEPLALLGTQCLAKNKLIATSPPGTDLPSDSCGNFKNWVELLVEQDALYFDRAKHQGSGPSFATGTLSGNLTIRPIAYYISALRANHLVRFEDDAAVNSWLKRRVGEYSRFPAKLAAPAAQNLVLHSVVASLTVGIATGDDRTAIVQAEKIYKLYMDSARPDGSFPQETKRGPSALKYENTALTGLVLLGELAALRGKDLYSYKSESGVDIHKAVNFYLKAYDNEALIAEYASENYAPTDKDRGGQSKAFAREHTGWMPIYLRRFPNSINKTAMEEFSNKPGMRLSGVFDENMGGITGCIW